MLRPALITTLVACLVACTSPVITAQGPGPRPTPDLERALGASSVPFRSIGVGSWFPFLKEPRYLVIETPEALEAVFAENNRGKPWQIQEPIDFEREVGILVIGPTFGCITRLEILAVEEQGPELVVRGATWDMDMPDPPLPSIAPDRIPVCLTAVDCPYHLIAVDKTAKAITFAPLLESFIVLRPPERPWPYPVAEDDESWKTNPRGGLATRSPGDAR